MKKLLFFYTFFISWSNFCLAQTISIKNSSTFEPIPLVNISLENGEGSFTSDEKGLFILPINKKSKNLIFSAIGYEQIQIPIDKIKDPILLDTKNIILKEVTIKKTKKTTRKIGSLTGKKIVHVLHEVTDDEFKPCIIAKYFDLKSNSDYSLLKTIKIKTSSTLNSLINFRIYSKGKDDKPGEILYNENLLYTVSKGDHTSKINIENLGIFLPTDGFFIAVEILVIDKNRQENKYTHKNIEHTHKFYYPIIKMTQTESYTDTWYNIGEDWQRNNKLSMLMEMELEE